MFVKDFLYQVQINFWFQYYGFLNAHLVHILNHVTQSFLTSDSKGSPRALIHAKMKNCNFSRSLLWDTPCVSFCKSSPLTVTAALLIGTVLSLKTEIQTGEQPAFHVASSVVSAYS